MSTWIGFALILVGAETQVRAQTDNVLILLADDVGLDKLSAYGIGPSPPPTPNIDGLAANGVVFLNAWANPECAPTRACIQTGRYSFRTGVGSAGLSQGGVLRLEETTIPEMLDRAGTGYAHGAFGKWHLSDQRNGGALGPNLAGWSHYAGSLGGAIDNYFQWPRTENGVTAISTVYATTQTVDDALAWIASVPEPWVCYVAFQAAHNPRHDPPAGLHSYSLPAPPESRDLKQLKAMIEAMDTEIGRLFAGLGPKLPRTNVIFAGDNGTENAVLESPYPFMRGKHTPYQGGVAVPLIISGPAVQSPGRTESALVGLVDLYSTVADLCGADPEPPGAHVDSVSLWPYLAFPGQVPLRSTVLAEGFIGVAANSPFTQYGYRDQQYKLAFIRYNPNEEQFYDLINDPYEAIDLLQTTMTPAQQQAYLALKNGVAQLRSPAPTTLNYGALGCQGSVGRPAISAVGVPRIGTTYSIELTGAAPLQPAALLAGLSRSSYLGIPLPFALEPLGGGPGCFIYAASDSVTATTTDGNGYVALQRIVPNDPRLQGASLYYTWISVDPTAPFNPLGITASDGMVSFLSL